MSSFAIQVPSPFVTKKRYAEMTGLSIATVDKAVSTGKLPIMPKETARASVLINLVALYKRADEQQYVW